MMIIPPSSIFRLLKSSRKLWTKGITMELNRCTSHLVQGTYNFWKDAYLNFSLSYLAKKKKKRISYWVVFCVDLSVDVLNYFRYISAERYSEALDVLQSGACIQLENGQVTTHLLDFHVIDLRYIMSFFLPHVIAYLLDISCGFFLYALMLFFFQELRKSWLSLLSFASTHTHSIISRSLAGLSSLFCLWKHL